MSEIDGGVKDACCPRCGSPDCNDPDSKGCSDNCIGRYQRKLADARAERDAAVRNSERYTWILHRGAITDFIFKYLNSAERHVSNAIDAAIDAAMKDAK